MGINIEFAPTYARTRGVYCVLREKQTESIAQHCSIIIMEKSTAIAQIIRPIDILTHTVLRVLWL